jgi:hypothetical protein
MYRAGPQPGDMKYREDIKNMTTRPKIKGMFAMIWLEMV